MPPRKRATVAGADPSKRRDDEQPSAAKRQRVSLACDGCRAAREKCDGARPQCRTCLSQSRTCSYTPASKKRGVQTGYLRAVELSLAWLLEQVPGSEETLIQLLSQNIGTGGAAVIISKDHLSNRLHRRWTKSRVHREIGRLLSDGSVQATDPSPEETGSDTEQDSPTWLKPGESTSKSTFYSTSPQSRNPPLTSAGDVRATEQWPTLPSNWQRLIEIYVAYTHCWLPVSNKQDLLVIATEYFTRAGSVAPSRGEGAQSRYAELWAVLSVASFQDAQSLTASTDLGHTPATIFSIARTFLPLEDGPFDLPSTRAILLHALVLIGRGNHFAASLLVVRAARVLTYLQSEEASSSAVSQYRPLIDVCFIFDAVISACLRQPLETVHGTKHAPSFTTTHPADAKSSEPWVPVHGFGDTSITHDMARPPETQPSSTLSQLHQFAHILAGISDPRSSHPPGQHASPDDLVRCLQPQFSFCNSVISGGSTPMIPSAYLVKVMFLATTIQLVPGHRSSLLSTILEVVEASITNFGACGTPPLVGALLRLVQSRGTVDMHTTERQRWTLALSTLHAVWAQGAGDRSRVNYSPTTMRPESEFSDDVGRVGSFTQHRWDSERLGTAGQGSPADHTMQGYRLFPTDTGRSVDSNPPQAALDQFASPNQPGLRAVRPDQRSSGHIQEMLPGTGQPGSVFSAQDALNQTIDYDAILEELGTLDYTDSIGMDPQFMVNLGFAPGCDLGEMFQGDFGS
ncbi:arginine deiminase type-3 [Purpureocillium lavendulum]|uniref:Arginine deiminase type-3 n=1 Tax=Purpureocillium lavendulum TaxID=1247861 RepID=A0AB34G4G1_9HYPO|nr:arginine deiminase type-3 [Purpureocillium lavendulum]